MAPGRVVYGTLVFLLVPNAYGVELLFKKSRWFAGAVTLLVISAMCYQYAYYAYYLTHVVPSEYNWFHLQ